MKTFLVPAFLLVDAESQGQADKLAIQFAMNHTRQEDDIGLLLDEGLPTTELGAEHAALVTMRGVVSGVAAG